MQQQSDMGEYLVSEEKELQQRSTSPRLFQLDALRGLAAVSVVLHHFRSAWALHDLPSWPTTLIASGSQAVVLFFVLSGYVLSLPYWTGKQSTYGPYVIRRICRIYLPFAAAAALSIFVGCHFFGTKLPLSPWFYRTWQTPLTLKLACAQFLMWPLDDWNTAFWSLRFEMQYSLIFPLVCAALKKTNALVFTLLYAMIIYAKPDRISGLKWHYLGQAIEIGFMFVVGATMARYRLAIATSCRKLGNWQWLLLFVSLLLYYEVFLRVFGGWFHHAFASRHYFLTTVGAAGIIICSLHLPPLSSVLKTPLPEYLGRISYSLYLTHSIVLFAGLDLLYGHLQRLGIGLVIIPLCFLAAHIFCVSIEEPSMRLGKLLAKRWHRYTVSYVAI